MSRGVPFRAAGKLGDYQCDLPVWTYHSILSNIKDTHPDIDYIFVTGDFPAHDSWRQNRSGNIESLYNVVQGIKGNSKITYTISKEKNFIYKYENYFEIAKSVDQK